jgi:hypothetical protein
VFFGALSQSAGQMNRYLLDVIGVGNRFGLIQVRFLGLTKGFFITSK